MQYFFSGIYPVKIFFKTCWVMVFFKNIWGLKSPGFYLGKKKTTKQNIRDKKVQDLLLENEWFIYELKTILNLNYIYIYTIYIINHI